MTNEYDNKRITLLTKVYYVPPNADGDMVLPPNNNRFGIIVSSSLPNTRFLLHAYNYEFGQPTFRLESYYAPFKLTYKDVGEMIKASFYAFTTSSQSIPIVEVCLPCECRLEIIRELGL